MSLGGKQDSHNDTLGSEAANHHKVRRKSSFHTSTVESSNKLRPSCEELGAFDHKLLLTSTPPLICIHAGSTEVAGAGEKEAGGEVVTAPSSHPAGIPMGFPDDDQYWEEFQRRKSQMATEGTLTAEGSGKHAAGIFSLLRKASAVSTNSASTGGSNEASAKADGNGISTTKASKTTKTSAPEKHIQSTLDPPGHGHKQRLRPLKASQKSAQGTQKGGEDAIDIRRLQEIAMRLEAGIVLKKPEDLEFMASVLRLTERRVLKFYEGKLEHIDRGLDKAMVLRKIPSGSMDKTLFPSIPEPVVKTTSLSSSLALKLASGPFGPQFILPTSPSSSSISRQSFMSSSTRKSASRRSHFVESPPRGAYAPPLQVDPGKRVKDDVVNADLPTSESSSLSDAFDFAHSFSSSRSPTSIHELSLLDEPTPSSPKRDGHESFPPFPSMFDPSLGHVPSKLNSVLLPEVPSVTGVTPALGLKRPLPRTGESLPVFVYDEMEVCHFFNMTPESTVHEMVLETMKEIKGENYWHRYHVYHVEQVDGANTERRAALNNPIDFFSCRDGATTGISDSPKPLTFRLRRRSTAKYRTMVKVEGGRSRSIVVDAYTTSGDVERILSVIEAISDEDLDDWGLFREYYIKDSTEKTHDSLKRMPAASKYQHIPPETTLDPWDNTKLHFRRKSNANRRTCGKVQVILGIESEREYHRIVGAEAKVRQVENDVPKSVRRQLNRSGLIKSQSTGSISTIFRSDPTETIFRPESVEEVGAAVTSNMEAHNSGMGNDSRIVASGQIRSNLNTENRDVGAQKILNPLRKPRRSFSSSSIMVTGCKSSSFSFTDKYSACSEEDAYALVSKRLGSREDFELVVEDVDRSSKKIATFFGVHNKHEALSRMSRIKTKLDPKNNSEDLSSISISSKPTFLARFYFANMTYASLNLPLEVSVVEVVPELLKKLRVSDNEENYAIFELDQETHGIGSQAK
ncbi:hypothetical protein HDU67_008619, partial [Dinochytrium kinnereticum]